MNEVPVSSAANARPIVLWDLVLSIVVLIAGAMFLVISAVIDLISSTLLTNCPAATCSASAAVASLGTSWFAMLVIYVAAAIATIVLIVRRRRAWWIAVVAVILELAIWIVGYVLFFQAVRHAPQELSGLVALGLSSLTP